MWTRARRLAEAFRGVGFRTRILAALIAAGAPGVVFGAIEAKRSFDAAMQTRYLEAATVRDRVASRLDDALQGSAQVLYTLTRLPDVARATGQCDEVLAASVRNAERYEAAVRVDAAGREVCASEPSGRSVGDQSWFQNVREGAPVGVSSLVRGSQPGNRVLLIGAPVYQNGAFDGAVYMSMRRDWLAGVLRQEIGEVVPRVFVHDPDGNLVAQVASGANEAETLTERGNLHLETWVGDAGALRLSVYAQQSPALMGLRAALVVASPLLVVVLTALAVWAAIEVWVLKWFHLLQRRMEQDAPAAPDMAGAPPELRELSAAFDLARRHARERQDALAQAVESNRMLTRDLHHRVKNNLQILISLLSRQQKHEAAAARVVVARSRCRVLAIALVHRFLDAPEHLGFIDMNAYLVELARQTHAALYADGKRARLLLEIDADAVNVSRATAIGLMVVETLVSPLTDELGDATIRIRWRQSGVGTGALLVEVTHDGKPARAVLDLDLVRQMGRQAEAEVTGDPGFARVEASFAPMDSADREPAQQTG